MAKQYRACLVGCGRMGATIDDEMAGRPERFLWIPYSHAAAAVACDRTDLVAGSTNRRPKGETARTRLARNTPTTDYSQMLKETNPDIVCVAPVPPQRAEVQPLA